MQTFIQKLKWMSDGVFVELFSLSSCLPGPTSTQVSFGLGAVKKGIRGGLLGGVLFQYPGLLIMSAVGVGAAKFLNNDHWWSHAAVDGVQRMASLSCIFQPVMVAACSFENHLLDICFVHCF